MTGRPKVERVQAGQKCRPARKKQNRNANEAQTVGLAILRLRRGAGMTLRQLAAAELPCSVASFAGRNLFSEPALVLVGELARIYGLDQGEHGPAVLGAPAKGGE